MHDEESSIEFRLQEWLANQGYPLEMSVSVAFQRKGFHTVQSEYYADAETSLMREIDVVAYRQRMVDRILFKVTFVIECKLSRNKPWVLFTSHETRLADPARVAQRAGSRLARQLLRQIADDKHLQDHPLIQIGERAAYGLTQAFTSGTDITYSAVTSVAKAALAQTVQADDASETQFPVCEIVFPLVVIDGRLFESHLAEHGGAESSEVPSGTLLWRNPLVKQPHSIIQILTVSGLDAYIDHARNFCDVLFASHDSELAELELAHEMKKQIARRKDELRQLKKQ